MIDDKINRTERGGHAPPFLKVLLADLATTGVQHRGKKLVTSPRLPSLIALRSIEAAARLENFSRAAAELHITHGAVSRAVRLLEDELGVLLFERRSRRVF